MRLNRSLGAINAHRVQSEVEIRAPAERVWEVLTDFAAYPSWNPFLRSIKGELVVGRSLSVHIALPGSSGMRFRLLANSPARELRWRGRLLLPGLFDGEHYFKLEATSTEGTRFCQGEEFTGLLVPLFRKSLEGATKKGYVAMNEALKQRAEAP